MKPPKRKPLETKQLDRRRLLLGTGFSLALPAFESVASNRPTAVEGPRRLVCIGNHLGFYPGNFFPKEAGQNFNSPSTLLPLEKHRGDFTVFSNLDHGLNGGHKAVDGFLTGIKKDEASGFPENNLSLDQAAAEHVGSLTRFPVINSGIGGGTDMCWTRSGVHVPPVGNPAELFRALFHNTTAERRVKERELISNRASALDALRDSAKALQRTLGTADQQKLEQYLTSVREVERRLQYSSDWIDRPKPEPPIPEIHDEERRHVDEIALLYDLIALAFQTDSTRVATLEIPMGFRTAELQLGSYHGLSHHSKSADRIQQLQIVESFFVEKLSNFLTNLKQSQLLDSTLVVFGSGMSDGSIHSNRNLPILLAGGSIGHQGHLLCPSEPHQRIPLSNLWLSVLQWFGAERDRFGRSTGTFSPLSIG